MRRRGLVLSSVEGIAATACVFALLAPIDAAAQKKPNTIPPGQAKRVQQVPGASSLVPDAADVVDGTTFVGATGRIRTLGSWLDDASALAPGEAWLALSASRWSMPIATGGDAPVVDLSVGLAPRVQGSMTVPYFRASDANGAQLRGLGDLYFGSKVLLRDPSKGLGVAVGATLELLSRSSVDGTGLHRVNWIFPLNLEHRFPTGRLYGSTGYFTRGVYFTSGAYEHPVSDRLVVTGALSHSYSTDRNAVSNELGLNRQRVDVSGTVAYAVSPALAVFGSLGRTIFGFDPDSTRMLVSGGVSLNLAPHR